MMDFHKPLAIVAHVAVFFGIAYMVAHSVLFFWHGPDRPASGVQHAVRQPAARHELAIDEIANLHLFGKPPSPGASRPVDETERLRETPLSLVLMGVFAADEARASTALIASKGQPAQAYNVGDRIPGNAQLEEVYWDRVVIRRGRVSELIRFEEERGFVIANEAPMQMPARGPTTSADARGGQQRVAVATQNEIADSAAQLPNDPRQLLADLGVGRARGDGRGGYTIGALADRPELSHTGLQRGDRVLAVNGRPVGDPEEDRLQIDDIVAHGSASLEIQRGDRRFVVTVSLN